MPWSDPNEAEYQLSRVDPDASRVDPDASRADASPDASAGKMSETDIKMTDAATTVAEAGASTTDWQDGNGVVAPDPLPDDHLGGSAGGSRAGTSGVRIVSMSLSLAPSCSSCVGPHIGSGGEHFRKPILTLGEAAGMLGVGKKRLANVISEEKARLGRPPDFVCDAGGRMGMRVLRDELLEWARARPRRRGRPPKQSRQ